MNPLNEILENYKISYSDSCDKILRVDTSRSKPRKKSNSSSHNKIDFKTKMKNFIKNYDELVDNLSNCSNDSDRGQTYCHGKSNFSLKFESEFPYSKVINDFYKYTEECILKISQIRAPTQSELSSFRIEIENYDKNSNFF
jgi:hypothetical protein